ncbi:expressed unknown protein [Seminavis robusta]|uniref:Uncharacterized protein n=1 Tax=Seminavis robusta TaxID=568900 RepID=A0A9N8HDP8_9STRA|nr:expressed unknown protein [Seminavis robusta]|eukprot:Sro472_g149860.1 n/a (412) ;mRNA; r:8529-9764
MEVAATKANAAKTRRSLRFLAASSILLSMLLQYMGSSGHEHRLLRIKEAFEDLAMSLPSPATDLGFIGNSSDHDALIFHNPRRFSNNIQLNVDRGLNIINCWSGQTISTWIYAGEEQIGGKFLTWNAMPKDKWVYGKDDAIHKIGANDTIFVSYIKMPEFTHNFLPHIEQEFVLITEGWHVLYPDWIHSISSNIVEHPKLLHWFGNNIGNYTGGQERHPKVSPFPLGLKPNMPGARIGTYRAPIQTYREIFMETLQQPPNKTTGVFVGFLRHTNDRRKAIPSSGQNLDYHSYLRSIAQSDYVLSPDGDHPDCHRHYESLGLGAMPITELDPFLFRHLNEGPVIFSNANWNVTDLEAKLPARPRVNRNLVFEEYWMEYVERVVGRPLRWWDVVQENASLLEDFAVHASTSET